MEREPCSECGWRDEPCKRRLLGESCPFALPVLPKPGPGIRLVDPRPIDLRWLVQPDGTRQLQYARQTRSAADVTMEWITVPDVLAAALQPVPLPTIVASPTRKGRR